MLSIRNQLQAEDASKMTSKNHESHPGVFLTIPSVVSSSVLPNFYDVLLRPCSRGLLPDSITITDATFWARVTLRGPTSPSHDQTRSFWGFTWC